MMREEIVIGIQERWICICGASNGRGITYCRVYNKNKYGEQK